MKLKKIASLMLAGIMAVSMLAACGEGKGNSSSSSSSSEVPVGGAAAIVNAELDKNKDKIEFVNDSYVENILASYYEKNVPARLNNYDNAVTVNQTVNETTGVATVVNTQTGSVGTEFAEVLASNNTTKQSEVEVYILSGTKLNKDGALKLVGQYIDTLNLPDEGATGTNKIYSYSGSVAIVKAETKGKTESAWVVAITITQTPSDM